MTFRFETPGGRNTLEPAGTALRRSQCRGRGSGAGRAAAPVLSTPGRSAAEAGGRRGPTEAEAPDHGPGETGTNGTKTRRAARDRTGPTRDSGGGSERTERLGADSAVVVSRSGQCGGGGSERTVTI